MDFLLLEYLQYIATMKQTQNNLPLPGVYRHNKSGNLRIIISNFEENFIKNLGPDHVQLTLLNWDTKSVLALNKNPKFPIDFKFFIYYQNIFGVPIDMI